MSGISLGNSNTNPLMSAYHPPLTVHVCWSAKGENPPRERLGRALYEFLCRPLDSDFAVNPGVGIPVRLGNHAEQVAAMVTAAIKDRGPNRPCIVAVPLLDIDARRDREFRTAVETMWNAGG